MYLGPVEKKAWGEQNRESVVRFREGKRTSFSDAIRNARRLFGPAFSARWRVERWVSRSSSLQQNESEFLIVPRISLASPCHGKHARSKVSKLNDMSKREDIFFRAGQMFFFFTVVENRRNAITSTSTVEEDHFVSSSIPIRKHTKTDYSRLYKCAIFTRSVPLFR